MNDTHSNSPLRNEHSARNGVLYASCTDLYSTMAQMPYLSHRLCTHLGKARSTFSTRSTTLNASHGNSPLRNVHCAPIKVFVHELYGSVQHYGTDALCVAHADYTICEIP